MNLNGLTIVNKRSIYDKNGKKLLTIPQDTSLDKIIIDLWSVIIKYLDYHPFIIGINVPGYRRMTFGEFDDMKTKFVNYNKDNNGIYFYGNLDYDNYIMTIEGKALLLNNYPLTLVFGTSKDKITFDWDIDNVIKSDIKYIVNFPRHITECVTILIPDI